jgi:hypothetical protein
MTAPPLRAASTSVIAWSAFASARAAAAAAIDAWISAAPAAVMESWIVQLD